MGDDLKFIDFYQLQIENKKYVKEIDEKNKKLLGLKISTSKINPFNYPHKHYLLISYTIITLSFILKLAYYKDTFKL